MLPHKFYIETSKEKATIMKTATNYTMSLSNKEFLEIELFNGQKKVADVKVPRAELTYAESIDLAYHIIEEEMGFTIKFALPVKEFKGFGLND